MKLFLLAALVVAQALPALSPAYAAGVIEKKEKIARHDPLTCPIVVSKIVTQGAWSFVDAGCGKAGEGALVMAVFHYNNGAWNLACTHSTVDVMSAGNAASKCGMTKAQAIGFGFPDNP